MTTMTANLSRINKTDDWYEVLVDDSPVGQVWKTKKKGWWALLYREKKRLLEGFKTKEIASQAVVGKHEAP